MRNYNLIAVISAAGDEMLFCKRRKPPYEGLYNFVGGKIEPGENGLDAAYRELFEETGIRRADIGALERLMVLEYPFEDMRMEVYAGRLKGETALKEEKNPLAWMPVIQDYRDETRFAGRGNLAHIAAYIRGCTDLLEN